MELVEKIEGHRRLHRRAGDRLDPLGVEESAASLARGRRRRARRLVGVNCHTVDERARRPGLRGRPESRPIAVERIQELRADARRGPLDDAMARCDEAAAEFSGATWPTSATAG